VTFIKGVTYLKGL